MVVTHTHAKIEVKGQFVQKIEWKQMDRQTDGHNLSHHLSANAVGKNRQFVFKIYAQCTYT